MRNPRSKPAKLINSSRCMVDVEQISAADITHWLLRWREGDQEALERLTLLVYHQLRHLAALLYKERPGHTLQPTALVHELYFSARDSQRCRLEMQRAVFRDLSEVDAPYPAGPCMHARASLISVAAAMFRVWNLRRFPFLDRTCWKWTPR
jgi:hypothetical protein